MLVDLQAAPPPPSWGVTVDDDAIAALADRWAAVPMPLPAFDYPGTPTTRDEAWWFDYVTVAVSVLACLWPPEGRPTWHADHHGRWLDDAPGIFAVFTALLGSDGFPLARLAELGDAEGRALFDGRGELQLVDERVETIRGVASAILDRWGGSVAALVAEADRDAAQVVALLIATVPGYQDRPESAVGTLPFDKLAHLAAALMAAGVGWTFTNFEDFPVYPDYMLPRVFRHHRCLRYSADLAAAVDGRRLIPADSEAEHAIRWATVYAGTRLRAALHDRGNRVQAPGLDYHLWSAAVLGPDAGLLGEHHRTLTLRY